MTIAQSSLPRPLLRLVDLARVSDEATLTSVDSYLTTDPRFFSTPSTGISPVEMICNMSV